MPQILLARPSALVKMALTTCVVALLALVVPSSAAHAGEHHPRIANAVGIAKAQLGDPYVYGANGPNAFDCAGLTSYAYRHAGRWLPRSTDQQWRFARHIAKSDLRKGDLMFFLSGGDPYHVGMFVGRQNGRAMILRASSTSDRVVVGPVWTNDWSAGTLRHRR